MASTPTRLAFNPLTSNFDLVQQDPAQIVTVGVSGCMFTSIQAAIDSITDAAANKQYTVEVAPGVYTEDLTLKAFVHVIGRGTGPSAPIIAGKLSSSGYGANELSQVSHISQAYTIQSDGEIVNDFASPVVIYDYFLGVTNSNDYGFTCIRQSCTGLVTTETPMFLGKIQVDSSYDGGNKDITAVEQIGTGSGHSIGSFTIQVTVKNSSGTVVGHKLSGSSAARFLAQSNVITINNDKAGSTATICGRMVTTASSGFRIATSETVRLLGYGIGSISCVNAASSADMFHAGSTAFIDSTMTGYVADTAITDTQKIWLQSSNRDLGLTGAGLAIVTPYCEVKTGFNQWSTAGATYWSYVASTRTFTLDKRFTGVVKSAPVVCAAGQSVVLTDYAVNFIYSTSSGVLQTTTSTSLGSLYRDNIVLFEVWVEGGRIIACFENHPVEFSTAVAIWAHGGFRSFLENATSTLAVNSSAGRTLNFVGTNQVLDHGLSQSISSTTPVTWSVIGRRTSDGKAYIAAASSAIPTYYDTSVAAVVVNAGAFVVGRSYEILTVGSTDYTLIGAANNNIGTCFTATGVGAGTGTAYRLTDDGTNGDWFVYRLGVLKGTLNSADPQWVAIYHNAVYANETAARNAIAAGSITAFPSEILSLEVCQVGYGIIQGNGTGGSGASGAVTPVTALQVIGAQYVAGGTSTAGSLITLNTTNFAGQLSGSESNVQAAIDRLDDYGYIPAWQATTGTYRVGNTVTVTAAGWEGTWICKSAHTAGATFAADIQLGYWDWLGSTTRNALLVNSAAHGFAIKEVLYNNAGTWTKSQGSGFAASRCDGMIGAKTTDYFLLTTSGLCTLESGTFATGVYYLSSVSAGTVVATAPQASGSVVREIGSAPSSTTFYVAIKPVFLPMASADKAQNIATGGTLSLSDGWQEATVQYFAVAGTAPGNNTISSTPFGTTAASFLYPRTAVLFGTSDTNLVVIETNDIVKGALLAKSPVTLGRGDSITLRYSNTLDRWVEITRDNDVIAYQYGGTGLTALGSPLQVLRTNAGATAMEWAAAGGDLSSSVAVSVDEEIARFDGITGKVIQTTGTTPPTISDTGILNINNVTDATSTTDGSLQTDGGLSVVKAGYFGGKVTSVALDATTGRITTDNATDATNTTDGSLQTDGGLSVAKAGVFGGKVTSVALDATTGRITTDNATDATTGTDGSMQTDGGLSVAKAAFVGTIINVGSATTSSTDPAVNVNRTLTGAGNSHGYSDSSTFNKDATTAYASYDARVTITGSQNRDHYVSFQAAPTFSSYTGTLTNLYGVYSTANTGTGATITSYSSFRAANPSGSSTITNHYAIYIENQTVGTNKYAIYSASTAPSYFSGYLHEFGNNDTAGNESVLRWIGKTSGGTAQYAQWEYKNTGVFQISTGSITGIFKVDVTNSNLTFGTAVSQAHTWYGTLTANIDSSGSQWLYKTNTNAATAVTFMEFQRADGGNCGEIVVNASAQTASYSTSSDARLKIDQGEFSALSLVDQVVPKKFKWKHNEDLEPEIGFYAQELKAAAPWAVVEHEDPEEMMGVDYGKVTGILWKAIREQQSIIHALEERLAALENKG